MNAEKADSYHHGDLKQALIRRGLEVIEDQGVEGLSFRSLTRDLGVSKAAPYRHFANKEDFLGSLLNCGFEMLYNDLQEIEGTERSSLVSMGRAYMRFALNRPKLYRLMFSPLLCSLPDRHRYWSQKALSFLCQMATGKLAPDVSSANQLTAPWAYIHGLVTLKLDGLYPGYLPQPDWEKLPKKMRFFEHRNG